MLNNEKEASHDSTAEETKPSRLELLSIVRKHSSSLEHKTTENKDVGVDELDMRFWREMFEMFFFSDSKESKAQGEDDMIFFVRNSNWQNEYEIVERPGEEPYFVRRWNAKLEKVVGENISEIDWRRSFYLNLIAHTSFTITVAVCSIRALELHRKEPGSPLPSIYKVRKTVYASPSRVNFHLDSSKAVETIPAYPDICFAVDDFDDTFDAVVLTETDHCYCVLLNANGGAAFPPEMDSEMSSTVASSRQITLFSGFVSYAMVREAYDVGRAKFSNFIFSGNNHPKSEKLLMKGPGGCGEVEVAVSGITDQSMEQTSPSSSVSMSKREGLKLGLGTFVRKAAIAASMAHAYVNPSHRNLDSEMLPLRCCLMSLSLPWDTIAYYLLFKGLSTIDL